MKKQLIISFLLMIFSKMFSQEYNNQSFKINNFFILNNGLQKTDKSGLIFSVDITPTIQLKDAYQNPYFIDVKIYNTDNQLIYQGDRMEKIFAKQDFFDKTKVEKQSVKINIPFEKLKTKKGKQQIKIKISAENDEKEFPVFFNKTLLVKIPETYDYNQQEFYISSFLAKQFVKDKVKGIIIKFNYQLKFDVSQIRKLNEHPEYGDYVFYLKFFNSKDHSEIKYFVDKNAMKLIHHPLLKNKDLSLFVPAADLKLRKGKYQLKAELYAVSGDEAYQFGKLAEKDLVINQPQLYNFVFTLNNCSVKDDNYDTGTVLGQVFSSSTSNKGKGYPDVYWLLRSGNIIKYASEVYDNVLYAPKVTAKIIIAENDPLMFVVYDKDFANPDDFIGKKTIENIPGEFNKNYTNYKNGGIKTASFSYIKKKYKFN